jgi:hypothetical protein
VGTGPITLGGVDCSDGLARCQGGVVEVSVSFHYPEPCSGPPEKCRCPWERLDDCPGACAADGVELVISRERARRQLCAPTAGESFAGPAGLGDADVVSPSTCEGTYACFASTILACGPPRVAVAMCARGCAGDTLEDPVPMSAATALLCSR